MDRDIEDQVDMFEIDPLSVDCPWCFAAEGDPCRNSYSGVHASRTLKAQTPNTKFSL
jgi:hypothetical protein